MITKLKKLLIEHGFTEVSSLWEFEDSIKEFPRKKVWFHDPIGNYCYVNTPKGMINLPDERLALIIKGLINH